MKKKLLCMGLVAVFAISTLAFAGCGGADEKAELEKQLSAAQSVVQRQETEISELEKLKAELQEQIEEMNRRLKQLENQVFVPKTVEVCEEGFINFSVTVNQTKVRIGDKITVTLTLENTSGKDIEAEIPDWLAVQNKDMKEDILETTLMPDSSDYIWGYSLIGAIPRPKLTFKRSEIVKRTVELKAAEAGNFNVYARACFFIENEKHFYESSPIKVIVEE